MWELASNALTDRNPSHARAGDARSAWLIVLLTSLVSPILVVLTLPFLRGRACCEELPKLNTLNEDTAETKWYEKITASLRTKPHTPLIYAIFRQKLCDNRHKYI